MRRDSRAGLVYQAVQEKGKSRTLYKRSPSGVLGIANLLREAGPIVSNGRAFRMIQRGAARLDDERIEDRVLETPAGKTHVCQVGRRKFARVGFLKRN